MGTYTDFTVSGYPLINSKSDVVPEAMTVFREEDRCIFPRKLGERNPLVWGDAFSESAQELETAITYTCTAGEVIDRLEVMGFTIGRARREFESGRDSELGMYQDWAEDASKQPWYAARLQQLQQLSFDEYLGALHHVLREGLRRAFGDHKLPGLPAPVRYILDDDGQLFGLFTSDIRCLIRVACEGVPRTSPVIQDITDLVEGGYYGKEEPVCQQAIDSLTLGHIENSKQIILTEGVSDSQVLKSSMKVLYPHLCGYYSFLDFDGTRAPGGAGQLALLVKSLAAAGIGNRIIAIFDNDSAARDAMRVLTPLRLPPNISVLKYPDIELLRTYPTIGPAGHATLDVNGLAASIELYFGEDVLRRADNSLAPVQWRGYIEPLESYQGEVVGKSELQAAFSRKLAAAERDRAQQDWSGIDAILNGIFRAFPD